MWENSKNDHSDIIKLYEDHTLVWLDKESTDFQNSLISNLRVIISHIEPMRCVDACFQYLSSINKDTQQLFLVICGQLQKFDFDDLLERVADLHGFVYLWQSQNKVNIDHTVRGSFVEQEELITKIASDLQNIKGDKFNGMSTCLFDVHHIRYKCFQLSMEILQRTMPPQEVAKENMIRYCERNGEITLDKKVDEFRNQYTGDNAITWYSSQSFFKKIFDRDLRSTDFNLISNFSFYLTDLYNALHTRYQISLSENNESIVYRGIALPKCELEELKEKIGCLVSNNTFLSTTCKRDVALSYAIIQSDKLSKQSVLFDIHINNKIGKHPFADISDINYVEGEILLSVGTVFRIDSVCEPESNDIGLGIWTVKLTACEEEPVTLNDYFDIILLRLTDILRRISPDSDRVNMKLIERCRLYYCHDPIQLRNIDDFEKNYTTDQAIRWYTKDAFLYRILNAAFRQNDMKTIIDLRFFIVDLYDQLTKSQMEYLRTLPVNGAQTITLYRGQLISKIELEKLKKWVGKYISINSFFSTSTNEAVGLIYSGYGQDHISSHFESILFVIIIHLHQVIKLNANMQRTVFARMNHSSIYKYEEEVLLSNQNVFRLNYIQRRSDYPMWSVNMTLCGEDQYLDNTHRYIDSILSPMIHLNLDKCMSSFTLENLIGLNNQEIPASHGKEERVLTGGANDGKNNENVEYL